LDGNIGGGPRDGSKLHAVASGSEASAPFEPGDRLVVRRVSTQKKTYPSSAAALKAVVAAGVSYK
jgi:hypothetical protein